jgi:hypothetical protein
VNPDAQGCFHLGVLVDYKILPGWERGGGGNRQRSFIIFVWTSKSMYKYFNNGLLLNYTLVYYFVGKKYKRRD